LQLEIGVEIGRTSDTDEAVGVCELGKGADVRIAVKVGSNHVHDEF